MAAAAWSGSRPAPGPPRPARRAGTSPVEDAWRNDRLPPHERGPKAMADRVRPDALRAALKTLRVYLDDLAKSSFDDHATKLRLFVNYFQRDDTVRYLAERLHMRLRDVLRPVLAPYHEPRTEAPKKPSLDALRAAVAREATREDLEGELEVLELELAKKSPDQERIEEIVATLSAASSRLGQLARSLTGPTKKAP